MVEDKIGNLVRVYQDLERTLRNLKQVHRGNGSVPNINLKKLINQLSVSKKRMERKIGNTVLLEKQNFKNRIRSIRAGFSRDVEH